ncbi:hypothetical protein FIBSPDRAFT_1054916 [Athelia psychrophila]|uniref:Uncharacterized protein n=1 Tax=Athelia psychrophila TaxID=1759441 RepID=A0A167ULQ3_9AGAM|nr:hypothetical protein FIBSPDRAFT_1054916 [Fibularhizoctonia sp. CBS 109695]
MEYLATPNPPADSRTETAKSYNPDHHRGNIDVSWRGSIPELPRMGFAAGDGETVTTTCPISPFPEKIPSQLSLFGTTSPNIKDTWGGRQELTPIVLEVKSDCTAAAPNNFDPSAIYLSTSTALGNLARHESQPSSPRSPIREELTSENRPQNAISPVDIESQQGNRVDIEDQERRAENSETGQGGSNIYDGNNSIVEELTRAQKTVLQRKLKKAKELVERVKNEREEAERVNHEKEQAKQGREKARKEKKQRERKGREEAERAEKETEQADMIQ